MVEDEKSDAEVEREIRQGRQFSPQEALARMAGPGAMKGASAVSPQQQAENAVAAWLSENVEDPQGSLRTVLHRQIKASKLLLDHIDQPVVAASACIGQLLASDHWLQEIVRLADVEWGRSMDERPHFDREGMLPNPDDPYTVASVRKTLEHALRRLAS